MTIPVAPAISSRRGLHRVVVDPHGLRIVRDVVDRRPAAGRNT